MPDTQDVQKEQKEVEIPITTSVEEIAKLRKDIEYWKTEARDAFAERKEARNKVKEKEVFIEETKNAELLKVKDYEALKKKLTDKEQELNKQQDNLKDKIIELTLKSLASDMKIKKPDYINLMKIDIEVDDDLNVSDLDEIKKKLDEFKKENLDLFNQDDIEIEKKIEEKKSTIGIDKKGPADPKVRLDPIEKIRLALKARTGN